MWRIRFVVRVEVVVFVLNVFIRYNCVGSMVKRVLMVMNEVLMMGII